MLKTILAAAALFTLPAMAHAEQADQPAQHRFSCDGVEYTYTAQMKGKVKILRGSAFNGREPFELHVSKTEVTGTFNDQPVAFALSEVRHTDTVLMALLR